MRPVSTDGAATVASPSEVAEGARPPRGKRIIDLLGAGSLLVLLSLLFAVVALLIRLSSRGDRRQCVGRSGPKTELRTGRG